MSLSIIYFIDLIMITLISSFFVGTKGMHIKRIVTEIPTSLLANSIVPIDDNEKFYPYFSIPMLKKNINSYLTKSLKNECNSYYINFSPYKVIMVDNQETYYIDTSEYIKNVQMHFRCNYFNNFNVDFYMKFIVLEKGGISSEF